MAPPIAAATASVASPFTFLLAERDDGGFPERTQTVYEKVTREVRGRPNGAPFTASSAAAGEPAKGRGV
jgi:hypothetical protein